MVEKIHEIIIQVTQGNVIIKDDFGLQTNMVEDIGLDSLQMIEFLLKLEEEFNLRVDFENLNYDSLLSVKNLCDFITSCQAK